MSLIPPIYMDTVVAIGFKDKDNKEQFCATGFFYGHEVKSDSPTEEKKYAVFLVTNRHVFEGHREAVVRLNAKAGQAAQIVPAPLVDASGSPIWRTHADKAVDIAVVRIQWAVIAGMQVSFFEQGNHTVTSEKYVELGGGEGDGVFLLGFPMGLVGDYRNRVIVRGGTVARLRDCSEGISKTFLVDANVFPGNSGGPVVSRPEHLYIQGTKAVGSAYLLGVVSEYISYRDVAVSSQTGRQRITFEENASLAVVVPCKYVEELAEQDILLRK